MAHIELIFCTIHKYLSEINPTLWSQNAFGVGCKSNMLLNNLAETFNSWIKKVYCKPIITICEKIRRQLLNRFYKKKQGELAAISYAPESMCPKIFKKLEKIKSDVRVCVCRWQNGLEFEADHPFETRRLVDLKALICSSGQWQLCGISCIHACATIYHRRHRPKIISPNAIPWQLTSNRTKMEYIICLAQRNGLQITLMITYCAFLFEFSLGDLGRREEGILMKR